MLLGMAIELRTGFTLQVESFTYEFAGTRPRKVAGWVHVLDFTNGYPMGPENHVTSLNIQQYFCKSNLTMQCFSFLSNRMMMNRQCLMHDWLLAQLDTGLAC
jgi:hypothetical protein